MRYRVQFESDDPVIAALLEEKQRGKVVVQALTWWANLGDTLRSIDSRLSGLEKRLANQTTEANKPPEVPAEKPQGESASDDDVMERLYKLMESGENFGKKRLAVT